MTVLNQRFCKCLIKCIGDVVLNRPYRAMLRKEDIRATDKDHVDMYKCYRPGDIILARVVSFLVRMSFTLDWENEIFLSRVAIASCISTWTMFSVHSLSGWGEKRPVRTFATLLRNGKQNPTAPCIYVYAHIIFWMLWSGSLMTAGSKNFTTRFSSSVRYSVCQWGKPFPHQPFN